MEGWFLKVGAFNAMRTPYANQQLEPEPDMGLSSSEVKAFHSVAKSLFLVENFTAAAEELIIGLQGLRNIERFISTMKSDGSYSDPEDMETKANALELTKSCLHNFTEIA